jgi:PIN domain nuclease of toxin-antitoxin system
MALLLDTNAAIYLGEGKQMRDEAVAAIDAAALAGMLLVSPVSGWEIGLLVGKRRLSLSLAPLLWFHTFLGRSGARLTPLTAEAAINSSFLPEPFHGDPADRMLVATARELGAALVTRDARILAYAEAGQVQAMAC